MVFFLLEKVCTKFVYIVCTGMKATLFYTKIKGFFFNRKVKNNLIKLSNPTKVKAFSSFRIDSALQSVLTIDLDQPKTFYDFRIHKIIINFSSIVTVRCTKHFVWLKLNLLIFFQLSCCFSVYVAPIFLFSKSFWLSLCDRKRFVVEFLVVRQVVVAFCFKNVNSY